MAYRLRLPDFIIGGAPKCATSSLHHVLAEHREIGIPKGELHFFDADDPITLPDLPFVQRGRVATYDAGAVEGSFFDAYAERFRPFQDARFIGEDSTTYIYSEVAASRIKRMLPDVKLIFMLRNPVERAYSHYWYAVNQGRATVSFERALTALPRIVLASTYARHLERYFQLFGRDGVKVILFEDFVREPQVTVDSVTDYLGASRFSSLPERKMWSNRTPYPKSPSMQLQLNRLRRRLRGGRRRDQLNASGSRRESFGVLADHALRWLTGYSDRAPPMLAPTREFLTKHMSERNRGLSDLLQRDLSQVWKGFTA